jgi:uncharacterized repeat protein (TIGR01451 family)
MRIDTHRAGLRGTVKLLAVLASIPFAAQGTKAAFPGANGKIAFNCSGVICVVAPDGSGQTQLAVGGWPAWSPDGTKLAFSRGDSGTGTAHIFVMNADGTGVAQLTSTSLADFFPAWSPDGTRIAFTRNSSEIWAMNADGTGQTLLKGSAQGANFAEKWSPDGTRIVFVKQGCPPPQCSFVGTQIFVMNPDGSGEISLTPGETVAGPPDWSPDGTKIAYNLNGGVNDRFGIIVMNADGSAPHALTTQPFASPAWSPDGQYIVFVMTGLGPRGIFVMNAADGSGQTQITSNAADLTPDWQPAPGGATVFADLALTLAGSSKTANTNKSFTYTITVENHGPGPAAGVVVSDFLDLNEQFQSVTTSQGACTTVPAVGSSGRVECQLGLLAVSDVVIIEVVVTLPSKKTFGSGKPTITNTAFVAGTTVDAVIGNNTATRVTSVVGP